MGFSSTAVALVFISFSSSPPPFSLSLSLSLSADLVVSGGVFIDFVATKKPVVISRRDNKWKNNCCGSAVCLVVAIVFASIESQWRSDIIRNLADTCSVLLLLLLLLFHISFPIQPSNSFLDFSGETWQRLENLSPPSSLLQQSVAGEEEEEEGEEEEVSESISKQIRNDIELSLMDSCQATR